MDPTWWVREEEIPPLLHGTAVARATNQVDGGAMIPRGEQQKEGSLKIVR